MTRINHSMRGFTLIETVVAAGVSAILLLALGSTVMLASRAVPTGSEPLILNDRVERAIAMLRTDVAGAVDIQTDSGALLLAVPDRSGDGKPEFIVYALDGKGRLTRAQNAGSPHPIATGIDSAAFSLVSVDDKVAAMRATIRVHGASPAVREVHVRLLNAPEAR